MSRLKFIFFPISFFVCASTNAQSFVDFGKMSQTIYNENHIPDSESLQETEVTKKENCNSDTLLNYFHLPSEAARNNETFDICKELSYGPPKNSINVGNIYYYGGTKHINTVIPIQESGNGIKNRLYIYQMPSVNGNVIVTPYILNNTKYSISNYSPNTFMPSVIGVGEDNIGFIILSTHDDGQTWNFLYTTKSIYNK